MGRFDKDTKGCACYRANFFRSFGFCLDNYGRCTILKTLGENGQFQCSSGTESKTSADLPAPIGWSVPANGCLYGSWNGATGECECIRSGNKTEVGFCRDIFGVCSYSSERHGGEFACPAGSKCLKSIYPLNF